MPPLLPSDISGVIVTRGDKELTLIREKLAPVGFDELLIWSNGTVLERWDADGHEVLAAAPDLAVYGRYAAIESARNRIIYVQDDDCLVDAAALVSYVNQRGFDLSVRIVANMPVSRWPDYPDSCLVGWGALFDRDLPLVAVGKFALVDSDPGDGPSDLMMAAMSPEFNGPFLRECDVVVTTLTPHVKVDVGFQHLPWAEDPGRAMFKRPWRQEERDRMYRLARAARG